MADLRHQNGNTTVVALRPGVPAEAFFLVVDGSGLDDRLDTAGLVAEMRRYTNGIVRPEYGCLPRAAIQRSQ